METEIKYYYQLFGSKWATYTSDFETCSWDTGGKHAAALSAAQGDTLTASVQVPVGCRGHSQYIWKVVSSPNHSREVSTKSRPITLTDSLRLYWNTYDVYVMYFSERFSYLNKKRTRYSSKQHAKWTPWKRLSMIDGKVLKTIWILKIGISSPIALSNE